MICENENEDEETPGVHPPVQLKIMDVKITSGNLSFRLTTKTRVFRSRFLAARYDLEYGRQVITGFKDA